MMWASPFLATFTILTMAAVAVGVEPQLVYPLQRIPTGTEVVDAEAGRWNRLILMARPMVTSGDIDQLPSGLPESVSRFSYTVMATVSKVPPTPGAGTGDGAGPQAKSFRLAEVGTGYSATVQGRRVIVTASQDAVNANLGIIDRQVLAGYEQDLESARVVVRSSTLMMFDCAANLARESGHRQEQVRNVVWIDPGTGQSAMAMWLVQRVSDSGGPNESLAVRDDLMQLYPGGTRGNNRLHIDASTMLLGIPTPRTFALEHLFRGTQIEWTDALRRYAARSSYTSQTLAQFTAALNEAIRGSHSEAASR